MQGIETILNEKKIFIGKTNGDSMSPMLRTGLDTVIVVPPTFPLKKGDVPVYRRDGHYTMHRIIHVSKRGYVICGDNRFVLERDITDKDIIGVLAAFYRENTYISCTDADYLQYTKKICRTYPLRLVVYFFYRLFKKIKTIGKGDKK